MEDTFHSDVFGVEKETGKVEGILAAVYQSVFRRKVLIMPESQYFIGSMRMAAYIFSNKGASN